MLFIFCFYTFLFNLENMSNNVRKFRVPCDVLYNCSISLLLPVVLADPFVIFDTYDVVYNCAIYLLPPIVLDNLFALH